MPRSGFQLFRPNAVTSSVICASPHSGREYAWSFMRRSALSELAIRSSEDAFVDKLIEQTPNFGASLLVATVPRAFVDFNRSADELDPALIEGVRKVVHNPRVASGLGVIPRVVANNRLIYRGKLNLIEAQKRLNDFWHPYHSQLSALLQDAWHRFGSAVLLDFHSMPHEALEAVTGVRPEIVLGDRYGVSASNELVDQIESAFASAGFKVARNAPFAGAYVTQTYGCPSRHQHAVQIEIDRSIYMNEKTMTVTRDFKQVKRAFTQVLAELCEINRSMPVPLVAE